MFKLKLKTKGPANDDLNTLRSEGNLAEWNDERGYGFITPDNGGQKVFLHIKSLLPSARRPVQGEHFFYKLTVDEKGRPRASEAYQSCLLDERRKLPLIHSIIGWLIHLYLWPLAVIPALIVAIKTGSAFAALAFAFVLNSLLTILFYREDKYRAQYKCWRIPEINLHAWELLCGWPGALYAQSAFRHKRSKISFMIIFWFCAILNVLALLWLWYYGNSIPLLMQFWNDLTE